MKNETKVISIENRKKLFTRDNWQTFQETNSIEGTCESNDDLIFEVRLRNYYKSNEKKALVIIEELKKIRNKYYNNCNDKGYGSSFEIFAISVLYSISYDEAYHKYIIQGNEDGGIDAIYWNSEKIIIYQIKTYYEGSYDKERMESNFLYYFKKGKPKEDKTSDLNSFIEKHRSKLKKEFETKLISHTKKANIKTEEVFDLFFKHTILGSKNDICLELDYYNNKNSMASSNESIYALFIKASDFINALKNAENVGSLEKIEKYFDNNVRGELKENTKMVETINEDPTNFVNYNNGITISGSINHSKKQNLFTIESPTITNGQQTVRTLIKHIDIIDKVYVLVILKNVGNDNVELMKNIAKYTNSQTKVKEIDLLSINEHVRELQKRIYENESDFFLDICYSGNSLSKNMSKRIFDENHIIKLKDFLKLYYSSKDGKIGEWKNSVSKMIEKNVIKEFEINNSIDVCKCIIDYKSFIASIGKKKNRDLYRLADLALMNISLERKIPITEAAKIIDRINNDFTMKKYPEYKTIKDLFRSSEVRSIIANYH